MAVVVGAISVIIRVEAVKKSFFGGVANFVKLIPNKTMCSDGLLCRVGFMALEDAEFFINQMFANGLAETADESVENQEIAIATQNSGLLFPCAWIEVAEVNLLNEEGAVLVASLKGVAPLPLAVPVGWTYEDHKSVTTIHSDDIKKLNVVKDNLHEIINSDDSVLYIGRPFER
jgi:hypothetical protein